MAEYTPIDGTLTFSGTPDVEVGYSNFTGNGSLTLSGSVQVLTTFSTPAIIRSAPIATARKSFSYFDFYSRKG